MFVIISNYCLELGLCLGLGLAATRTSNGNLYMSTSSTSSQQPEPQPQPKRLPAVLPFQRFAFAPNNVCIRPHKFYAPFVIEEVKTTTKTTADANIGGNENKEGVTTPSSQSPPTETVPSELEFTMRNVPGEGDCMFLAVALATSTSMGLGGNYALLRSVAQQTRSVVAQVLSAKEGTFHVEGKRIVRAVDLLKSAAKKEGLSSGEEYIDLLTRGVLQGGGPELTVLSNVLRRPISIYELDMSPEQWLQKVDVAIDDDDDDDNDANNDTTGSPSLIANDRDKEFSDEEGEENIDQNESGNTFEAEIDSKTNGNKQKALYKMIIPEKCRIKCVGKFGDIFKDPLSEIPDPAVISGLQEGAYSWHIHILVVDSGGGEKHACTLLPKFCYM